MKRIIAAGFTALAAVIALASSSFATGFRLPEQSAAAMGMSSAFVAQADDASAAWYNPAGLTDLKGTQIAGGVIAIYPVLTHDGTAGKEVSDRDIHLPIHFYATHKYSDAVAFGLSINNPFGLATDWDKTTSTTKYVATFSKVVTTEVNPSIAYRINDRLSTAFGVDYVQLRATLEKTINVGFPGADFNFRLNGDGDGYGFNAAIKYKISNELAAGLSYRSRIKVNVEGEAVLSTLPTPTTGSGNTSLTLPDLVQVGISYRASDKLILNADVEYTFWSTYDRIVVESNNPSFNSTDEKNWNNTYCLRLGGQYTLSDTWKLRAGALYDKNPVPEDRFETRIPDSDRVGITLGTGFTSGNLSVDLAYLYLKFLDRSVDSSTADNDANPLTPDDTLNGDYKSLAQLFGVTVGYRF